MSLLKKSSRYAIAAIVAAALAGCALPPANSAKSDCVGPPSFCVPYFGS